MAQFKILIWNANGLLQHSLELKKLYTYERLDIFLISETHFMEKLY